MENMKLIDIPIEKIHPYENNPRKNDAAVDAVAESISQCEYIAPIIVDENYIVLAGHTRLKALKKLGYKSVPCIVKEGLSEEQKRKYRLLDNKTSELSEWDFDKLDEELKNLDLSDFDFGFAEEIDWASISDLTEDTYEEPDKSFLQCPSCHHVDSKERFKKVEGAAPST